MIKSVVLPSLWFYQDCAPIPLHPQNYQGIYPVHKRTDLMSLLQLHLGDHSIRSKDEIYTCVSGSRFSPHQLILNWLYEDSNVNYSKWQNNPVQHTF